MQDAYSLTSDLSEFEVPFQFSITWDIHSSVSFWCRTLSNIRQTSENKFQISGKDEATYGWEMRLPQIVGFSLLCLSLDLTTW